MRKNIAIFKFITIVSILISASIADAANRVFVYKMENGEIVFRTCTSGKFDKKFDCVGPSSLNHVAPEYFEKVLWSPFLIINSDKMKPLSDEEVKAYQASGIDPKEILKKRKSNLLHKLGLIEKLIVEDTNKSHSQQLLKKAKKQLLASDPSTTDVLKLNDRIKKTLLDRMNTSKRPHVLKADTPHARSLWRQFDASIPECGTDEKHTLDQRIAACASAMGALPQTKALDNWKLVARKKNEKKGKYYEVWKDTRTGLVWGDVLDKTLPQYFLIDINGDGKVTKDKLCTSEEYNLARAYITDSKFSLPTISELEQAIQNGMSEVLPNTNNWFWSATSFPNEYQDLAWGITNGLTPFRDFDFKYYYAAVRCVARSTQ